MWQTMHHEKKMWLQNFPSGIGLKHRSVILNYNKINTTCESRALIEFTT